MKSPIENPARPPLELATSEAHALPALPYALGALAPVLGARTLALHHGHHHKGYVDALNTLLQDERELAHLPLEELVPACANDARRSELFDNAAQAWNHAFYWNSMKPQGGGVPAAELLARLQASFGDFARFKAAFVAAGKAHFGSGWLWLVHDGGQFTLETTADANTPMARGKRCLLTCDLWEHAYYLDYQNRRGDYLNAFLERLVDWDFARKNLR